MDRWLAQEVGARTDAELPRALARAQFRALAVLLDRVRQKSAFYAKTLRNLNRPPANRVELGQLPLTTAQDVTFPYLLTTSLDDVERLVTLSTSGTSGAPKRLAFTRRDLRRTRDFFAVGLRFLVQEGQTVAVLLPGGERPQGVADLIRQALEPCGCTVLAAGRQQTDDRRELRQWVLDSAPEVLIAMPSQLQGLMEQETEWPGLTGILSSAEPLEPGQAERFRAYWQCQILNHYGLTEVGYGCAVECPSHSGMHLRAMDVLVEIIDPVTGEVLPPGDVGEIVVTTLRQEAMPLVRYRTGDVASLLSAPCSCGSPLERLGPILGRLKDGKVVQLPKGGGL